MSHVLGSIIRVRPVGFEPTTPWSEAKCSNPLSYGRLYSMVIGNKVIGGKHGYGF